MQLHDGVGVISLLWIDGRGSAADAKISGEVGGDYAGACVSDAGDINADGFDDLLVSSNADSSGGTWSGAAYLILGPVGGTFNLAEANAKFHGEAAYDYAGKAGSLGDIDADGFDDIIVGAYSADIGGAAYVVMGWAL